MENIWVKFLDASFETATGGFWGVAKDKFKVKAKNAFRRIVLNTLADFAEKYPMPKEGNKLPFYAGNLFFDAIPQIFSPFSNQLNEYRIIEIIKTNPKLIVPSKEEAKLFLEILRKNLDIDEEFKSLYVEEFYKIEIFKLSPQLEEIKQHLINSHPDQRILINWIHDDIIYFNPKTALKRIEQLELLLNLTTSETEAQILFLKALSLNEMIKGKKASELYIKAYLKQPNDVKYKENVLYYYWCKKDLDKTNTLIEEILSNNPYNSIAWALKSFLSSDNIRERLSIVPNEVLEIEDYYIRFKSMLVNLLIESKASVEDMYIVFEKEMNDNQFIPETVTFDNKNYWFKLATLKFQRAISNRFLLPDKFDVGLKNSIELKYSVDLLQKLLSSFEKTEKIDFLGHYRYLYSHGIYLLRGNKETALKVLEVFKTLSIEEQQNHQQTLIYTLSQSELFDELLTITQDITTPVSLTCRGYALERKGDVTAALDSMTHYFDIQDKINAIELYSFAEYQFKFPQVERENNYRKFENKFESEEVRFLAKLITEWEAIDTNKRQEKIIEAKRILDQEPHLDLLFARLYMELGIFEEAEKILRLKTNINEEGIPYQLLIVSLEKSHSDDFELLKLLENWRLKDFTPNIAFLIREISLLYITGEWQQILDAAIYAQHHFNDALFLYHRLNVLLILQKHDEIRNLLKTSLNGLNYSESVAFSIAKIAIEKGEVDYGASLIYPYAIAKDNFLSRQKYFHSFLMSDEEITKTLFAEHDFVKEDCTIICKSAGTTRYIHFNQESIKQNPFYEIFRNKKKDDECTFEGQFIKQTSTYQILSIVNKYGGLFIDIRENDIPQNREGSFFHSFKIDPENVLDSMHNFIIENFGEQDNKDSKAREQVVQNYTERKHSFSELVRMNGNYPIDVYLNLINDKTKGFNVIPKSFFNNFFLKDKLDYVLDFTSVLLFAHLEWETDIKFSKKFWISQFLIDRVLKEINEISLSRPMATLQAIERNVHTNFFNETYYTNRVSFLAKVFSWIQNNCEVKTAREKLTMLGQSKLRDSEESFDDTEYGRLVFDTMFIANKENAILISDDQLQFSILYQHGRMISSEFYLAIKFPNVYSNILLRQLIKMNYYGVELNEYFVLGELNKFLKDEQNLYGECLKNLSVKRSLQVELPIITILLVKAIYASSILLERKHLMTQNVFSHFLKDLPRDNQFNIIFQKAIIERFALLPHYINDVLVDFRAIWQKMIY
jgi:hypothetical protein